MNWYPQALLTAEQACRRRFFFVEKRRAFFETCPFSTKICMFTHMCCLCIFLKALDRRGTNRQSKWRLNFVLSSHIDPIGDQNDVQYLSIYWVYLVYLVLGTYCTYCTCCTYVLDILDILYILYILYTLYIQYSTYCTYCTVHTVQYILYILSIL